AALAALRVLAAEPERPAAALAAAAAIAASAGVPAPAAAVVSVVLGDPAVAFEAARRCLARGLRVGCFRPPSVPVGTSRLRLTARATLTAAELELVRVVLAEVLGDVRPAGSAAAGAIGAPVG
ncbi:MAG: 8-amino-7-oxononanoate synthase, partial [Pseudonocardiales bacterium]|nr:8-amino-7-oxononanoate synthase [Pseudonocardiales bacterium]